MKQQVVYEKHGLQYYFGRKFLGFNKPRCTECGSDWLKFSDDFERDNNRAKIVCNNCSSIFIKHRK